MPGEVSRSYEGPSDPCPVCKGTDLLGSSFCVYCDGTGWWPDGKPCPDGFHTWIKEPRGDDPIMRPAEADMIEVCDACGIERTDFTETMDCPHCGEQLHYSTEQPTACQHCGSTWELGLNSDDLLCECGHTRANHTKDVPEVGFQAGFFGHYCHDKDCECVDFIPKDNNEWSVNDG